MKIIWSPESVSQVNPILRDMTEFDAAAANRRPAELLGTVERIATFSKLGREVPQHKDPKVRQLLVGKHWVAYHEGAKSIEIYAVWHGARRRPGRGIAGEVEDE